MRKCMRGCRDKKDYTCLLCFCVCVLTCARACVCVFPVACCYHANFQFPMFYFNFIFFLLTVHLCVLVYMYAV